MLIILPLAGLTIGGLIDGATGMWLGAGIGLVIALLGSGVTVYAFAQMRRRP